MRGSVNRWKGQSITETFYERDKAVYFIYLYILSHALADILGILDHGVVICFIIQSLLV